MTDQLPERIWIDEHGGKWSPVDGGTQRHEYIPRAKADAMVAAAWQAAAEAADALGMMWWAQYKYRKSPHCASTHREGMSDGAADVAKHIRQSTPSEARAAFEQAVQEAVEAALQQATLFCTDCGHPVPAGPDGRGSCGHGRVMRVSTLGQHEIGGKND